MKAFDVEINGKICDYRVGKTVDLKKVRSFLEKTYTVHTLWQAGRHVLGTMEKNGTELFFKLATTEGISYLTKNEYEWNKQFNKQSPRNTSVYWVPQNVDCGMYENTLFYLITDVLPGKLLAEKPEKTDTTRIKKYLPTIVQFSELISTLDLTIRRERDMSGQDFFYQKTLSWYEAIPKHITEKYKIIKLLEIVEYSYHGLMQRPRHGDFTPWHMLSIGDDRLGLIDGEHAMGNGVEYYDIGYFIQRVFCILENPDLAKKIVQHLADRKYKILPLQTILAARGIGGFLDESLKENSDYTLCDTYSNFVLSVS